MYTGGVHFFDYDKQIFYHERLCVNFINLSFTVKSWGRERQPQNPKF